MVPPLIPHCFDHVWNLKRLSIIILVSRRNEEREKKKERKKINKKESSSSPGRVRVIIERGTRHLPVKSTHVAARGWKILEPIFQTKALLRGSSTCLTRVITHFNGRQIMLVARVVRPFLKIGRKGDRKRERESRRLESEGLFNGGTPFQELASDDTRIRGRCRDSTGIEPGIMRRTYVCGLHNLW